MNQFIYGYIPETPYEEGMYAYTEGKNADLAEILYIPFSESWREFCNGWADGHDGVLTV